MRTRYVIISLSCVCGLITPAALGQPYQITWHAIGGGSAASAGGSFALTGTTGRPDASAAGAMAGGPYSLTGGFWAITLPSCSSFAAPDIDRDCDVDVDDFVAFNTCATRSNVPYAPGCAALDFDSDADIDLDDFALLQRCYSGAGNAALSNCAQ